MLSSSSSIFISSASQFSCSWFWISLFYASSLSLSSSPFSNWFCLFSSVYLLLLSDGFDFETWSSTSEIVSVRLNSLVRFSSFSPWSIFNIWLPDDLLSTATDRDILSCFFSSLTCSTVSYIVFWVASSNWWMLIFCFLPLKFFLCWIFALCLLLLSLSSFWLLYWAR